VLQGGRALPVTFPLGFAAEALARCWISARLSLADLAVNITETVEVAQGDSSAEHMTAKELLRNWSALCADIDSAHDRLHTGLPFQTVRAGYY
jgi:hypothetical protein